MGRSILGFLAGAAMAMVVIALVEGISSFMHPIPEGVDISDAQAMKDFVATLPPSAFVMVVLAWSLGAMAAIINMALIPHPGWMWAAGIVLPAACGYLGGLLGRRPASPRPMTPAGSAPVRHGSMRPSQLAARCSILMRCRAIGAAIHAAPV